MSRHLAAVVVAALVAPACAKKATVREPATLTSERITDDSGEMMGTLAYLPQGDTIEFVVELKALGTEEMDKVVIDMVLDGFVLVEGQTQWGGFVAPLTKHRERVVLRANEGVEFATVTVTVSRSVDSHVLMQTEAPFRVSAGQVVPAQ